MKVTLKQAADADCLRSGGRWFVEKYPILKALLKYNFDENFWLKKKFDSKMSTYLTPQNDHFDHFLTGLTGHSSNLDPTGPVTRLDQQPVPVPDRFYTTQQHCTTS